MSKTPFLKGQRRCIFCGNTPVTREHMWADWLRDYIPREMQYHTARFARLGLEAEQVSYKKQTGDPHSRRIPCVCAKCNNEWMSGLQEDAKPFLVPMLQNKPVALHKLTKTMLATWVTMTTMVAEYENQAMVAIPQSDRTKFFETQHPLPHWRIWIGSHRRQNVPMFHHNVLPFTTEEELKRLPPGAETDAANTQTTTICLGKYLVIHVMSSVIARSIVRRWKLPRQIRDGMTQIWPIRPTKNDRWPLEMALNDNGITLLADEFLNKAVTMMRLRGSG